MASGHARQLGIEHDGTFTVVNGAAVRAREALTGVSVLAPAEDVALRLQAAATALGELAAAIPDGLRFQTVVPLRVPPVAEHGERRSAWVTGPKLLTSRRPHEQQARRVCLPAPRLLRSVPEFLRTRKEPEMEAADATAEADAAALPAALRDPVAYNAACRDVASAVASATSAALANMAAATTAALAAVAPRGR